MFIRMPLSLRKMLRISSTVLATHKITVGGLKVRTLVARGKNLRCHAYFEFSFVMKNIKSLVKAASNTFTYLETSPDCNCFMVVPCGHHVDISFKLN